MDGLELTSFVEQVAADAERAFGPQADPIVLECYAREAVIDLWLTRPRVTVYLADLALRRLRDRLAHPAFVPAPDSAGRSIAGRAV